MNEYNFIFYYFFKVISLTDMNHDCMFRLELRIVKSITGNSVQYTVNITHCNITFMP